MFIEDRFDGGPRFSLSFHGLIARKLNLSTHRIEVRCFGIPVPRSGTYLTKLHLKSTIGVEALCKNFT